MKTVKAFRQAEARAQQYLKSLGIALSPQQAAELVQQYAGHSPWQEADFKRASRAAATLLGWFDAKLTHAQSLELISRIEGLKSWNVMTKHFSVVPGDLQDAPTRVDEQVARLVKAADLAVSKVTGSATIQQRIAARVQAIYQALTEVTPEIGDSSPCVNVEYDVSFRGGDYANIGDFVAVPLGLVDMLRGSVEDAFSLLTGLPAACIVHYTLDEVVDQTGHEIEERPEPAAPSDARIRSRVPDQPPLMWINKDRALTETELQAHTEGNGGYVKAVVDVNWDLLGDIEALNDEVSERIAGCSCDLVGIGYRNYFPTDDERMLYGEPMPDTVWIQVTAVWEPCE